MKRLLLLVAPALFAAAFFVPAFASAATFTVNNGVVCSNAGPTYCNIQPAINAASAGDTVDVYPGTYNESAPGSTPTSIAGTYQFGLFFASSKPGLKLVGVDSGGSPITSAAATLATINTDATNDFGTDGIFVEGANVVIQGVKIGPNLSGDNKTIEVVGDNFTLQYSTTAIPAGGGSIYIDDFSSDGSVVKSYHILDNIFPDGTSVDIASGAGLNGLVSGREILRNTWDLQNNGFNAISFNGSGTTVPWFVNSVGGAVIQNNSFKNSTQYIRARGTYDNTQFDWQSYWNDNTFDKAAVALVTETPFDVQSYTYTSGSDTFPNTRRIGANIQPEIGNALAGDTVLVKAGTYPENVTVDKTLTLKGAQADVAVASRTFSSISESTISGPTDGVAAISLQASTTFDGFSITNARTAQASIGLVVKTGADNSTVDNNIFDTITTQDVSGNGTAQAVYFGNATNGVQIVGNKMNNIHSYRSAKGVLFGDNGVSDASTNVLIEGNDITNVTSDAKGAYGVSFGNTTTGQSGVVIKGNTINGLTGGWVHAIGIEGNVPDINVNHNVISGLTSPGSDVVGVWFENEDTSFSTAKVNNNSLDVGSSKLGLAVHPALSGSPLDGTCNWWGSASGPSGVGPGTGSMVTASTTYTPWLGSSNLDGSCSGGLPAAVTTNPATSVDSTDATLNGTNGPTAADNTSFWWGTTSAGPFTPAADPSSEFPVGWNHDGGLGAAVIGASFNEPLTGLTSGTTYYFVAWVQVGGIWYPDSVLSFDTPAGPTPSAITNSATGETSTTATVNGTDGPVNADNTSFWWGTTSAGPFDPAADPTSEFPAGWSHDPGLAAATAGAAFNEPLSGLTPGTKYYFAAWSHVGGVWYPGAVLSFITPAPAAQCPAGTVQGAQLESFNVDSSLATPILSAAALTNGQPYILASSGTWQNGGLNAADAAFSSLDSWVSYMEGYDISPYILGPNEFNLQVNGNFVNWGAYSPAHTYSYLFTGTGSQVSLGVFDGDSNANAANAGWYGDNSGSLAVAIYPCVPATASITITKVSSGGNGTFNFTSDIPNHASFSITTANNTGSISFSDITPGTYHVTEVNMPKGWTQTDTNCDTLALAAGNDVQCTIINTNNKLLGSIRGTKYADRDGDGTLKDGDHHRLAGVTIYIDKNNDGVLDAGDISTVTNSHGLYIFPGLLAGTYVVREVVQSGWVQTYPSIGSWTITLASGQNAKQKDFGNFQLGSISGMKYNDANGNGKKDSSEVGLAGWTIQLKKGNTLVATAVTAPDGSYSFSNLAAGTYTLSEVAQAGWNQTQHPGSVKIQSGTNAKNENFGNTTRPKDKDGDYDGDNRTPPHKNH